MMHFLRRSFGWIVRILFWGGLAAAVLAILAFVAIGRELSDDLPPVAELLDYRPPTATRVYAADGSQIAEFYQERRYLVPIADVPPHVRNAFIAAEDASFYTHRGIDPSGIARAILANWQKGGIAQGASTITQQVVKQLLLSPEKSFERKAKELILALELESRLTKDEILYLYLNQIYFGAGTYGIAAASQTLFGTRVQDLSLAQAAVLAGLPQAPSRSDPLRNPEAAIKRQHYVLDRMVAARMITVEQKEAALAETLSFANEKAPTTTRAAWYVEHVRRLLEEQYGPAFADLGLRVHTAVDLRMQDEAEQILYQGLRRIDRSLGSRTAVRHLPPKRIEWYLARQKASRRPEGPQQGVVVGFHGQEIQVRTPWETAVVPKEGLGSGRERRDPGRLRVGDVVSLEPMGRDENGVLRYSLDQDPQIEGALVAVEPESGLVKALVGGVDYGRSQFNRATLAKRQPGSAFKPLIYSAAIDKGYTPSTIVEDAPISLPDGKHGRWTPKNSSGKFAGRVPLRTALAQSLNTVSVRLALAIGIDPLRDYLRIFGFPTPFPRAYSIALGAAEVTPLDLARAYGVIASGGRRFEPVFVTSVTDENGDPVDFPGTQPRHELVMNPATSYIVTKMMTGVIETGTAKDALRLGRPAAGKTGTTNEAKDAWFGGFTPELLTIVWVGYDADRTLGAYTGGKAATPIWTNFMIKALKGRPRKEFEPPQGLVAVKIDNATGLRAVKGRPSHTEMFVAGTEPKRFAPKAVAKPKPKPAAEEGGASGGGTAGSSPATAPAPAGGGASAD